MTAETTQTPQSTIPYANLDSTFISLYGYKPYLQEPGSVQFWVVESDSNVLKTSPGQPLNEAASMEGIVDKTKPTTWEELVSAAEERLQEAVDEALDEDGHKPTDAAMIGACDMLDIAGELVVGHDVETYATSSRDVITDVTDFRSNYVVFKNKAGGKVAVHYNINGYKEFVKQGDVDKGFVRSMLSALQRNPATT